MLRAISSAKSRHRSDVDQAKQTESDIAEATEYLEHASHLALSCLLLVGCTLCATDFSAQAMSDTLSAMNTKNPGHISKSVFDHWLHFSAVHCMTYRNQKGTHWKTLDVLH